LNDSVVVLNNYRGTGIGDFGATMFSLLARQVKVAQSIETDPNGRTWLQQVVCLLKRREPVIANLGLTAWGPSGVRNFAGFLALGARQRLGRPTTVVLHNIIEIIRPEDSGYSVNGLVRFGAHLAVSFLRKCHVIVFSPRMAEELQSSYGLRVALCTPLPCEPSGDRTPRPSDPPRFVTVGYIAPYKGVEVMVRAKELLGEEVAMSIIGKPHRVLSSNPEFLRSVQTIEERARTSGIEFPGYVPDEELAQVLASSYAGILSYTSTSGASASFATLASAGLPVVASDLPEFRFLREKGAGVWLVPADPEALAGAIRMLTKDSKQWAELVERQRTFTTEYSWASFVQRLLVFLSQPKNDAAGRQSVDFS
jgi:glycosyltransferase involved in cell wall biosynthesis